MRTESVDSLFPHNLPEQPNQLLGRSQELKAAQEQLLSNNVRLLSLIGPPGVGKTRLAIELAQSVREFFPEGIWFVDLAPLRDARLVAAKIASALGIAELRQEITLNGLASYLRDRQVLLLLDNFEWVLEAAVWVGKLLEQTAGLKILTTSRERLRLRWERLITVPPLPIPDLSRHLDLPTLAGTPSVALFLERAKAINAQFNLSPENASDIAALCTHLDGLPLAIELAASRTTVLSMAEIREYLDDRFHLLEHGPLDLPERHQTLKAAIDWSYESLPPAERQFLRRLSVFRGEFSLHAAEIVGEAESLGLDSKSCLITLTEKSLLGKDRDPAGQTRFTLLESIRAYVLDRLRTGGELNEANRRHAHYYLEFAERNFSDMDKRNMKASFDLLEKEHDNLRAALEWFYSTGEYTLGKRMAAALWYFWGWHGHISEAVHWLETFLESSDGPFDEIHLTILEGAGTLRGWRGDFDRARTLLMDALHLAQEREDPGAIIRILAWLGWIFGVNGKTEQADWLAENITGAWPNVEPWDLSYAYSSLGSLFYEAGRDEDAEREFIKSIEILHPDEKTYTPIYAESKLALLKQNKGEVDEATQRMLRALNASRQTNDLTTVMYTVDMTALLVMRQIYEKDIAARTDLRMIARIFGAVDRWREILSYPRTPRDKSAYLEIAQFLRRRLGEESFLAKCNEGQSMSMERVIEDGIRLLQTSEQLEKSQQRPLETMDIVVRLSEREHQVLGLVAEGLSSREIAKRLFITERTVRFHITSIFNKLGVNNRVQAVAIANRLGLL